jgi:hypothetical protein
MSNRSEGKMDKILIEKYGKSYYVISVEKELAAKRLADLMELQASLSFANNNLELMYANKNSDLVFSFYIASFSHYRRCFADLKGHTSLDKNRVFKGRNALLKSHEDVIKLRDDTIGHRNENQFELSKIYILKAKEGKGIICKSAYSFDLDLSEEFLNAYQELIDVCLAFVSEQISKCATIVWKQYYEHHFGANAKSVKKDNSIEENKKV